ncbi:MAG: type I 3-dehydroquinate dehydratase [Ferroplasma sp.]
MISSAKIYTSIFFQSFEEMKMEFDSGKLDVSESFELRFDLFKQHNIESLKAILGFFRKSEINYIFTYRSQNQNELESIYSSAMEFDPPIVDIDINSYKFNRDLFQNSKLMLSYHGINSDSVANKISKMATFSPDIYKIALMYSNNKKFLDDLRYLYAFKDKHKIKLAFIPMGNENTFLRLVSAFLLSDIGYASYKDNTAPGQLSISAYYKILDILKGKYE